MNSKKIIDSFIATECDGQIEVFLKGLSGEGFIQKLSLLGVDAHDEIKYLDKLRKKEFAEKDNLGINEYLASGVEWRLSDAIKDLMAKSETMDFALDYILRSQSICMIQFINKGFYPVPRPYVRRLDGSLRSEAELGVLATCRSDISSLIYSTITHLDTEALRYVMSLPCPSRFYSADDVSTDIKMQMFIGDKDKNYKEVFKDFLIYRKVEDLSVEDYLGSFDLWESEIDEKDADDFYNETAVKKGAEEILDMILGAGRENPVGANRFVVRMIQSGIDCYPGFIRATGGATEAQEVQPSTRDYQAMLDVCLKKIRLPGFKGLIASVPMTEIALHPRKRALANIVFELTGNPEAIKLMDKKSRGKALEDSLGL
jgi:hypothetical protein